MGCCASCWRRVENLSTPIVDFFESMFICWRHTSRRCVPAWLPALKIMALLTFFLIPLNIAVNFLLSYRVDPVSFFQEHSNFDYKANLTGGYLAAFWIHKLGSIMWNMTAITQLILLTLTPKPEPTLHRFNGYVMALSSLIMAICGCFLLANGDARYDNFTAAFVVIPAIVVFVCAPWLIIDRTRRLILGEGARLPKLPHMVMGFILCLPPLGMMLQFIFYSLAVSTSSEEDYYGWRISMYWCMTVGVFMLLMFGYNVWLVRHPNDNDTALDTDVPPSQPLSDLATHSDHPATGPDREPELPDIVDTRPS